MEKTDWSNTISPNTVILRIGNKDYAIDLAVATYIKNLSAELDAAADRIVELMALTEKKR